MNTWWVTFIKIKLEKQLMAKTTGVAKRDLKQIALEKTPLLRAALEELREEFPLEDVGQDLIAHLLHEEKLDSTNLSHQAKAIAFVSCRLNLALDRTTNGDRNKTVSVLRRVQKNPELLVKLYGVALTLEKSIQTLKLDPFIIALKRSPGSIDYYGLLDPQEETTLLNWNKNGLRDAYGLPPSSLKELDQIKARIESAQAISFLGTKIRWQEILKEWSISAFASRFFCRPEREKPAQAGIFIPFVTSLMIRTLLKDSWNWRLRSSGHKMEKTELFLFLDYELLKQFLELLLFDQESLFAEGKEAVKKIRSLLETDSLFFDRYTQEETGLFLKQLEPALKKFSLEARAFYMKIHSVEAPTPEEVDSFWRSKLFLYSRESAEIRLGKEILSARPVLAKALGASTLETLLAQLIVFHQWAEEDKQRFVEKTPFDLLLSREPKQEAETRERVLRLWNLTKGHADHQDYWRVIREKIDWSKRADLVLDIGYCVSSIYFENEWFYLLKKVKHWEYRHLDNLPACAGRTDEVLEIILKNIASVLSLEMWREIVKSYASNGSRPYVETVWRQMPQKYRARCFYEFSPLLFSFFLHRMNLEEVKNEVIPVLDALARQPQFEKNFLRWANQRKDNEQFPNIRHPSKGESLFLDHLKTLGVIL